MTFHQSRLVANIVVYPTLLKGPKFGIGGNPLVGGLSSTKRVLKPSSSTSTWYNFVWLLWLNSNCPDAFWTPRDWSRCFFEGWFLHRSDSFRNKKIAHILLLPFGQKHHFGGGKPTNFGSKPPRFRRWTGGSNDCGKALWNFKAHLLKKRTNPLFWTPSLNDSKVLRDFFRWMILLEVRQGCCWDGLGTMNWYILIHLWSK